MSSSSAPSGSVTYPYSLSFQSNASVAIIIVVLGATFFFMFLFVVYIKRCNSDSADADNTTGTNGGWSRQQMGHGLDPEVLQKFPIMRYASVKGLNKKGFKDSSSLLECAVCLGQFEENEEQLRLLPACGHLFHPECIDMWLQSHSTCPLCRRSLSRDAVSGHLQRALAAVTSSFRMASSPEGGGGGAAAAAATAEPTDLEAQDGGDEGGGRQHQQDILRALSRNSESFKMAAHEVAVREVRDKLRAASSSGRFGGSSSPARMSSRSLRATPSRREGSIINSNLGGGGGETPMTPIACGIHHSQSYSELRAMANSPLASPFELVEQQQQHKGAAEFSPRAASSERWSVPRVLASLRRSASTSSSSSNRVASSKL